MYDLFHPTAETDATFALIHLQDGLPGESARAFTKSFPRRDAEIRSKPVPLQPAVTEDLKRWRKRSPYRASHDFLFPSVRANGKHPIEPGMVLRNYIRPALARLGIMKSIAWHSFRHGFSNLLRSNGVDLKTAQELLRHANSRVTLDIYQQSVTEERRLAQAAVFEDLMGIDLRTP